ncbi:methionine--tRNA ligase [Acidiferrobacter thiooxydans]|uniref:methionine--tRNA ligase n=1 Tax=Acidiferrobacter thiooxydans TaxID=163359 RepID=UPI0008260963|nr:methionine--tRNA ligase [Acidiferrobacter thiooxydans]UEN99236.1 methionine--tRNA ligase [Acidiferrobacter thiooxydans]
MLNDRKILVTSALPYANGSIHIGHLVEYIQTDIYVRYQRLRGRACHYLCADDTHGTAIMLKAQAEGISPEQLIARVAAEHVRDFTDFGISFDRFGSTHSDENRILSEYFYGKLQAGGHIAVRAIEQAFDPVKRLFLPDRFIRGECPRCHAADQYGDSCEACGATYAPTDLINPVSALSGAAPVTKSSGHYFFKLGDFADDLKAFTASDALPREAGHKLAEWLNEGLTDWDISRDAPYFGFEIPGAPGKYFYVWLDAPVGYIATFWQLRSRLEDRVLDIDDVRTQWSQHEIHHFIGKDILNFHGLFWPAMLEAADFARPKAIHVHGFLTVNGKKMSKSRGTFITARRYLDTLPAEYLRYYFAAKLNSGIEDIDLNLDDFRARINADLVGKLVNIASRSAQLLAKHLDNTLGDTLPDASLYAEFLKATETVEACYEACEYSRVVKTIMDLADRANRYVDEARPWEIARTPQRRTELQAICTQTLNLFCVLIAYLKPILPQTATRVEAWLGGPELNFESIKIPRLSHTIAPYTHLMRRIEPTDLAPLIGDTQGADAAPNTPSTTAASKAAAPAAEDVAATGTLSAEDFARIDLRVARVVGADYVEGADKLLKLSLDLNEGRTRTVFAGIRHAYAPADLVGRLVVCVANLKPRKMRFGVSEGMVLAASDRDGLVVLEPGEGARPGMTIR